METRKLLTLTISILLAFNSYSQMALGLNYNYLTNNNETINWGFTIHPEYKFSHQWRVGISTSIFIDPNPFPEYIEQTDAFGNPNIVAGTDHRIFPIEATLEYYLNKERRKLQPYLQVNSGVAILGTFTKAEIKNLSYIKYNHETNIYFSSAFKVGTDYTLIKNIDVNLNAGYSRVFNSNANRFKDAPRDLSNYNSYYNSYLIFSAGFKYNFD